MVNKKEIVNLASSELDRIFPLIESNVNMDEIELNDILLKLCPDEYLSNFNKENNSAHRVAHYVTLCNYLKAAYGM